MNSVSLTWHIDFFYLPTDKKNGSSQIRHSKDQPTMALATKGMTHYLTTNKAGGGVGIKRTSNFFEVHTGTPWSQWAIGPHLRHKLKVLSKAEPIWESVYEMDGVMVAVSVDLL